MSTVLQIFQLFVLKRHPKDIDHNLNACLLLAFASVAIDIYALSTLKFIRWPLVASIVLFVMGAALLYNVIKAHGKAPRFVQMLTAMLGVGVICNLSGLFIGSIKGFMAFQSLIQFWGFYLNIFILKETLECSFVRALIIMVILVFTMIMFMIFMFADIQILQALQTEAALQSTQTK